MAYIPKHVFNLHRDKHPEKDKLLVCAPVALPVEYIDLVSAINPNVLNQGNLGSCTANAGAGNASFVEHEENNTLPFKDFSRLFIYFNERVADGSPVTEDAGSTGRTLMETLTDNGACLESTWAYDVDKFADKPTQAAYTEGEKYQGLAHRRIPMSETAIKQALVNRNAICTGISVYESFESADAAQTGIIPMPGNYEQLLGGHEVLLIGYKNISGKPYWILRNSWGADWGDGGNFYLPKDYLLNQNLTYDFWTLTKIEDGS